jgi:hypothetical protein
MQVQFAGGSVSGDKRAIRTMIKLAWSGYPALMVYLAVSSNAFAQPSNVPNLKINPVCRGIVQQTATPGERGGPDLTFGRCVRSEMAIRHKLICEWAAFTPTEKANCVGLEMGGFASYTD